MDLLFCIRKDSTIVNLLARLVYSIDSMHAKVKINKKTVYDYNVRG